MLLESLFCQLKVNRIAAIRQEDLLEDVLEDLVDAALLFLLFLTWKPIDATVSVHFSTFNSKLALTG